ncbi:MAG: hypothetical protein WBD47_10985, partial [Phormidesmis sp.]
MRTQQLVAHSPRTQKLLLAVGWLCLLGSLSACAVTVPPADLEASQGEEVEGDRTAQPTPAVADSEPALPVTPPELQDCQLKQFVTEPLSTPENSPVFEQFNFQPESITVYDQTVAVKTPHYTFHFCRADNGWIALANDDVAAEDTYDYASELAEIADPDYEIIEMDGQRYEYRVRLQASWLEEQLSEQSSEPGSELAEESTEEEPTEDTVYFELKTPDGDVISRQLYTLSELQSAHLGASLGVPRMAGAVVTQNPAAASAGKRLWFAATTSQGEGDNGFASLINYDPKTQTLSIDRPDDIQGDQITDMVATGGGDADDDTPLTLWLGTQRSGEGNPYFPASGLVAYQPETEALERYSVTNSSLVGAIPHQLALENEWLWVATGNGTCRVQWQAIDQAKSWECWRVAAATALPETGVDIYSSFLATEPTAKLSEPEAEVLWVAQPMDRSGDRGSEAPAEVANLLRYEVVYAPGFEAQLSQGGYRVANEVAKRAVGGEPIFWPGRQWHWAGDR